MNIESTIIDHVKRYFKDKPVNKAYLFGSYARGMGNAESDVDILVELDYSKPIGIEFYQMQMDLESLLHKKVDLVSANGISRHIQAFVENDKILIYAR